MIHKPRGGPAHKLVNSSQLVSAGPLWLCLATVAGDGANADCQIYDGIDTNGEKITHLEALSGTTFSLPIRDDILLRKGLYVVVNASTTFVTLLWYPAKKEDPEIDSLC